MRIPTSTYRIQFNQKFTLIDAQKVVPYLAELGISDIYASPIFKARAASTHGYDIVDSNQINPELGGIEALRALNLKVKEQNMGWVQDIVPNHMAFDSQNQMLIDLLENGRDSQYFRFFDIQWDHPYQGIKGRVLAPFLGRFYGDCLERGEIQLNYDPDGFSVNYYSLRLPLKIESYSNILSYNLNQLRQELSREHPDFVKFLGVLYSIKYLPSGEEGNERYDQIAFIKNMLWELWSRSPVIKEFITNNLKVFNGDVNYPESFQLLDSLLTDQFFRLSFWKVGNEEINYRRFFTVNDLICVCVERKEVFEHNHRLIIDLIREGIFTGLRIDHIDGLYDPKKYLERLRGFLGDIYIVVEKILDFEETLPINWPTQGTTGYDFLAYLNNLFCPQSSREIFTDLYDRFVGQKINYDKIVDEKKRLIISKHLAGDIDNLGHLLKQISQRYRYANDFTIYGLKGSLIEIMVAMPVYRTYINDEGLSSHDRQYVEIAIKRAKAQMPIFSNELDFIARFLFLDFDQDLGEEEKEQWLYFTRRLQQYTGPLMAKGVEDTAMYVYNRLISLNEVGASPSQFGISIEQFHQFNQNKALTTPHSFLTTSTHDTKRGEDTRARINVLAEIPQEWEEAITLWQQWNCKFKRSVQGTLAPTPNDEYLLYQTLIGAMPFGNLEGFSQRVEEYVVKAIREAKVHTGWLQPDHNYESACTEFVREILTDRLDHPFLKHFREFQKKIAFYGVFNSLSQVVLKLTGIGVPDIYQGSELWNFSLVDPDNRRPIDFDHCFKLLLQIKQEQDISSYLSHPEDGKIKLFITWKCLHIRKKYSELFQRGRYFPVYPIGSLQQHIISYYIQLEDQILLVVVPRFLTKIVKEGELPIGGKVWQENRLPVPPNTNSVWLDLISDQEIYGEETLWIRDIFQVLPVSVLLGHIKQ